MLNEAWRDSMMSLGASNTDLPGVLEAPKREEHISPFALKQLLREWLNMVLFAVLRIQPLNYLSIFT
jgi:hypothetical protein